jgi:hypothetical protein
MDVNIFLRTVITNCNHKGNIKNDLYLCDIVKTNPKFKPKENTKTRSHPKIGKKWTSFAYFDKESRKVSRLFKETKLNMTLMLLILQGVT